MKKALGKINFKGTLLEASYPPGFDEEGRRLLAECPEFKLWEMYQPGGEQILERSPVIERAYHTGAHPPREFSCNTSCNRTG